ncbi:Dam family site-specific DNA-(adenine-N6)-methyltransferase [Sulfobacillus thermosulfidooxidans]|uniref:Dam family site-specific DNA-(adenine-N6)-methyltransferase n=1 Tax=Sulfobacillus thermosulfidooxidans TaxID=28034 RepID=UPI0006B56E8D|nr:Dam family site-specific DNA-(adenine-N6)-methyltransferase [Sulfobacillus thermosulfidooxidans]
MKPFLKWAGGKYRLINRIRDRLPQGTRLIEPFVGSAAVWLNTNYPQALLADSNGDVIRLYQTLKQYGESFIAYCRTFFIPANNAAERYYTLRDRFNQLDSHDEWEKAALFLYLNRHGYNGLCRYNAAGAFNVPFGRYAHPYFPEEEMRYFAMKAQAQDAQFIHADFRQVMAQAHLGDVIYCDPPYVPLSETANFTGYAAGGFSSRDQEDLALLAEELSEHGIPVLISNHATVFTEKAYQHAAVDYFTVQRFISCDGNNRHGAQELLALFTPLTDKNGRVS